MIEVNQAVSGDVLYQGHDTQDWCKSYAVMRQFDFDAAPHLRCVYREEAKRLKHIMFLDEHHGGWLNLIEDKT